MIFFVPIFLKLVGSFSILLSRFDQWDHSLSTYPKLSEKVVFLTPWYAEVRCILGERNANFSENFVCVLNESQVMCSLKNDLRLATIPNVIKRHGFCFHQYELEKFSFVVSVLLRNRIFSKELQRNIFELRSNWVTT